MTTARYDLVILNHSSCKSVENLVHDLLVVIDKVGDPYLEYKLSEALLFEQNSSAILSSINMAEGEIYQEKFRELDVETELRPTLQLVAKEEKDAAQEKELHTCPACQHVQPRQKGGAEAMNTCDRCGVVAEKFKLNKRKKEVFQLEKNKLEQAQKSEMEEALERAHHDQEEMLRTEARKKLGVHDSKSYGTKIAAFGIVAVIGASAFLIAHTMNNSDHKNPTEQTSSAIGGTQTTTDSAGAKSDTDAKPMLTIQAGNGSIIVNNGPQDTGKGGAKGMTSESAAGNDSVATTAATNTAAQPQTVANTANSATASSQNEHVTQTAQAAPANTANTATGTDKTVYTTANNGSHTGNAAINPHNNSATAVPTQQHSGQTQLAALMPQQGQSSSTQQTLQRNTRTALSTAGLSQPQMLLNTATAPAEISQLKAILQTSYQHSPHFFTRLSKEHFEEHQQRLNRLLDLGKPDLALIFAEGIEDPYLASLLLLEVARHERKAQRTELNDAILLSMKALMAKSNSTANKAMLNASLSQAYDFAGDKQSARTTLLQSVKMLDSNDINIDQSCRLLAQMDQNHREFGNQHGADFMAETLINFANKLPEQEHHYRSRIYTHLASSALQEDQQQDAAEWLKQIPVQNAQEELLTELRVILAKNKKAKVQ